MDGRRTLLAVALVALALLVPPVAGVTADLRQVPSVPSAVVSEAGIRHLKRVTLLLQLRARFGVLDTEAIPKLLADEAERVASSGLDEDGVADLDRNLLAEGSYYIVSLRYLIESGGAIWPAERTEEAYINDARAELQTLQSELTDFIARRADPFHVFIRLDRINAWTEGFDGIPPQLDHFSNRDELVNAALATSASRS